jgi:hypothetical protein
MSTDDYSYIKQLRLLPQEYACHRGIPAATPVYVSPVVDLSELCPRCVRRYSSLLYAPGAVTRAQHYHDDTDGGIYFYITPHPIAPAERALATQTGWIAHLELLGACCIPDDLYGKTGRAEAVRCTRIAAWCVGGTRTVKPLMRQRHIIHPLTAGLLVGYPIGHEQPHLLLPICDQEDLLARDAQLCFQIRDGEVLFTKRQ